MVILALGDSTLTIFWNHQWQILTAVGWTWKPTRIAWRCLLWTMWRCWNIWHTWCDFVFLSLWPQYTASETLRIDDVCNISVCSILVHAVALFSGDDCLQDKILIIFCQTWKILSITVNIILTGKYTTTWSGSPLLLKCVYPPYQEAQTAVCPCSIGDLIRKRVLTQWMSKMFQMKTLWSDQGSLQNDQDLGQSPGTLGAMPCT